MKNFLLVTLLVLLSIIKANAQILLKKEIKVYNVPLKSVTNNTLTNPDLSKYGVLVKKEEQLNTNNNNVEYGDKVIVIFNKNYSKEKRIKILLNLLEKDIKKSDFLTKKSLLQLINLIKQDLPSQ